MQFEAWKELENHFNEHGKSLKLLTLFTQDPNRFKRFSINFDSGKLLVDFSKNLIDDKTLDLLIKLAEECHVVEGINSMFNGFPINSSEGRAALHTALRAKKGPIPIRSCDGEILQDDILPEVQKELEIMKKLSDKIKNFTWLGYSDDQIFDIVNIGIGGSDLGPVMACEALKAWANPYIKCHFVSNVDGNHLETILTDLKPENTLFIIVSKTFTTAETMKNACSARKWILNSSCGYNQEEAIKRHFVAVSTNLKAAEEFGIDVQNNLVQFWDWVGGRYSLFSGVGLSVMMMVGWDVFQEMLSGASAMDEHFKSTPLRENIPVLMALIGIWYNNFFKCETLAVLPYEQALSRFPAYLQQADMESNGKCFTQDGRFIRDYQTGPIVWGEPGTNGQHAFFQLIHQGTKMIPCDFIAGISPIREDKQDHHLMLLANFLAQTEALMLGKTLEQVESEHLHNKVVPPQTISKTSLLPQKTFPGNRPSTSILYDRFTPFILGLLIALYEHKIFVQGLIWQINSFDQWGVELGKQLATKILNELENDEVKNIHDQSTQNLIDIIKNHYNHYN